MNLFHCGPVVTRNSLVAKRSVRQTSKAIEFIQKKAAKNAEYVNNAMALHEGVPAVESSTCRLHMLNRIKKILSHSFKWMRSTESCTDLLNLFSTALINIIVKLCIHQSSIKLLHVDCFHIGVLPVQRWKKYKPRAMTMKDKQDFFLINFAFLVEERRQPDEGLNTQWKLQVQLRKCIPCRPRTWLTRWRWH